MPVSIRGLQLWFCPGPKKHSAGHQPELEVGGDIALHAHDVARELRAAIDWRTYLFFHLAVNRYWMEKLIEGQIQDETHN